MPLFRPLIAAFSLILVIPIVPVRAGTINHATATSTSTAGLTFAPVTQSVGPSSAPSQVSVQTAVSGYGPSISEGHAVVNGADPHHLISLIAESSSAVSGSGVQPTTDVTGSYTDTLRITNPSGPIISARVEATFSFESGYLLRPQSNTQYFQLEDQFQVSATSSHDGFSGMVLLNYLPSGPDNRSSSSRAWDSILVPSANTGIFSGTFHIWLDLTPDSTMPNTVSADWSLTESLKAFAIGGLAGAGLDDPPVFDLQSIRYADGSTPESRGYTISFASGMPSPNAVPELGSGHLVSTALLVGVAYALCRRMRTLGPGFGVGARIPRGVASSAIGDDR